MTTSIREALERIKDIGVLLSSQATPAYQAKSQRDFKNLSQHLTTIQSALDAAETDAVKLAENVSVLAAEKLATKKRERPWEDYAQDIEDVFKPFLTTALLAAAEHVPSDPTKASHPMVDAERLVQVVRNAIASQAAQLRDALYPYGVKHPQQSEWEWLIKCVVEMREQLVFAEAALTEQSEKLRKMRELLKRYRTETPLGNQPRMIAHEVDAALSDGE